MGVSSPLIVELDNSQILGLDLVVGGRWWRGSCSSEDAGQGSRDGRFAMTVWADGADVDLHL